MEEPDSVPINGYRLFIPENVFIFRVCLTLIMFVNVDFHLLQP